MSPKNTDCSKLLMYCVITQNPFLFIHLISEISILQFNFQNNIFFQEFVQAKSDL